MTARRTQQGYYQKLADAPWQKIMAGDWRNLKIWVGSICFGDPDEEPGEDNEHTGYFESKLQFIKRTCNLLTAPFNFETKGVKLTIIMVLARIGTRTRGIPIFKSTVGDPRSQTCIFVDPSLRSYKNWEDWLKHNKLPECTYCAPRDGNYAANADGHVELRFEKSTPSKLLATLDNVSLQVDAGLHPVVAGGFALYNLVRAAYVLVDRKMHGQSISLTDEEAVLHWLNISISCAGLSYEVCRASLKTSRRAGKKVNPNQEAASDLLKDTRDYLYRVRTAEVIRRMKEQKKEYDL